MTGELMASLGDLADQTRVALRYPTQNEEGRGGLAIIQQIEEALRVSLNAALEIAPACAWDNAREGFDVKIVLYVNGDDTPAVHRYPFIRSSIRQILTAHSSFAIRHSDRDTRQDSNHYDFLKIGVGPVLCYLSALAI
jgi:hypothetical protein